MSAINEYLKLLYDHYLDQVCAPELVHSDTLFYPRHGTSTSAQRIRKPLLTIVTSQAANITTQSASVRDVTKMERIGTYRTSTLIPRTTSAENPLPPHLSRRTFPYPRPWSRRQSGTTSVLSGNDRPGTCSSRCRYYP